MKADRKISTGQLQANGLGMAAKHANKDIETLVRDMQRLGFGEHEARAYIALLNCSPATAYELAKVAGLPKANAYTVVESLVKKGVAQPVSEKPIRYVPADTRELFSNIERETRVLCRKVFDGLTHYNTQSKTDYVLLLSGQNRVRRQLTELIGGSESHIRIKAGKKLIHSLLPEIKAACARGISVSIVVYAKSLKGFDIGENCEVLLHEGWGIAYTVGENFLTLTVDSKKAMIVDLKADYDTAYSENQLFVYMVDVLLKHEILLSQIMLELGGQIEAKWGVGFEKLRNTYPQ